MTSETTTTGPGTGGSGNPGLKKVIGPKLLLFFVLGDVLGTSIYSLTGKVAGEVGGALWVPFLVAFTVAFLTAFSYLELVGKYPRAAGAALYVHRAFGIHFLTFLVAFAVMCSGLTSASSAAQAFGGDYLTAIVPGAPSWLIMVGFLLVLAAINLRGVGESVKLNMVLTCIEMSGLAIVVVAGVYAIFFGPAQGADVDPGRLTEFDSSTSPFFAVTSATSLAFFAMVGFEDSVNMAEETRNPTKTFPRALLLALGIAAAIYLVIALITATLVPTAALADSDGPLLLVVKAALPWFPPILFAAIALFAVSNTALINMLMASRLLYGMANEGIIPRQFGRVHPVRRTPWVSILFTSIIALLLMSSFDIDVLGGTTSLLLLIVFTVVNVAVLVLRREKVDHEHFRAPTWVPVLGVLTCAFFASPLTGRPLKEYAIAAGLLAIGVVFWLVNYLVTGRSRFDAQNLGK